LLQARLVRNPGGKVGLLCQDTSDKVSSAAETR
jgi:hypothetical protein